VRLRRSQKRAHRRALAQTESPSKPWRALGLTLRPSPETLILLEVIPGVWIFEDSEGRLYRCEVDSDGNERWFVKARLRTLSDERDWISQSEAARLLGITRQAIGNAINAGRLATVDCNGRLKLCRTDVLAMKVRSKKDWRGPHWIDQSA